MSYICVIHLSSYIYQQISLFVELQEQESSQGSAHQCGQLEKARRELEDQLLNLSDRLQEEEACSAQLAFHRDRLESECGRLRRDLDHLESVLTAAERARQVDQFDVKYCRGIMVDLQKSCFMILIT